MTALAHDPYEITSVVYIQSNRIELFVEMEFPTAMTLAGQKPLREVSGLSQFEAALPQLEQLAGNFLEITAGNHAVSPLRTNVQLGVEDHIQCQVEFAPTDYRPLRVLPRGLRGVADSPYGISLTVIDMVKKQVLGQAVLFANSLAAEFPVTTPDSNTPPLAMPILAVTKPGPAASVATETNALSRAADTDRSLRSRSLLPMMILAAVGVLLAVSRWLKPRA
jgi:hypothetical protein